MTLMEEKFKEVKPNEEKVGEEKKEYVRLSN